MIELKVALSVPFAQRPDGIWQIMDDASIMAGREYESEQELRAELDGVSDEIADMIHDLGIVQNTLGLVNALMNAAGLKELRLEVHALTGIVVFPHDEMLSLADTILFLQNIIRENGSCEDVSEYQPLLETWQRQRSNW